MRVRLPISADSFEQSQIWSVSSNTKLPNKSSPASEVQEGRVIRALISELQRNLALDLEESPIYWTETLDPTLNKSQHHSSLLAAAK